MCSLTSVVVPAICVTVKTRPHFRLRSSTIIATASIAVHDEAILLAGCQQQSWPCHLTEVSVNMQEITAKIYIILNSFLSSATFIPLLSVSKSWGGIRTGASSVVSCGCSSISTRMLSLVVSLLELLLSLKLKLFVISTSEEEFGWRMILLREKSKIITDHKNRELAKRNRWYEEVAKHWIIAVKQKTCIAYCIDRIFTTTYFDVLKEKLEKRKSHCPEFLSS